MLGRILADPRRRPLGAWLPNRTSPVVTELRFTLHNLKQTRSQNPRSAAFSGGLRARANTTQWSFARPCTRAMHCSAAASATLTLVRSLPLAQSKPTN